jgi:O-antigen/teichoic acid export membrane protein
MSELVLSQLLVRIVATFAIVLLINSESDLLAYSLINAASAIVAVVLSCLLLRKVGVTWHWPTFARVWLRLRESSTVFLSNAAISFYTTANVLIVSAILGNDAAGIFGLADRIRVAVMGLLVPMSQAIYPFICRTVGSSDPQERLAKRRMFQIMIWTSIGLGLVMFVAAPFAVSLLGGRHFNGATPLVRIFSLIPVLVTITNILGVQMMLPLKMDRSVATVVITCAVIGVVLQIAFTRAFGVHGSAWAYAIVEFLVCCGFGAALFLRRDRAIASIPTLRRPPDGSAKMNDTDK